MIGASVMRRHILPVWCGNTAVEALDERARQSRDAPPQAGMENLISILGEHRQRREFDAFVVQFFRLLRRGDAVDRAVLSLAVVNFAGFLGKRGPTFSALLTR